MPSICHPVSSSHNCPDPCLTKVCHVLVVDDNAAIHDDFRKILGSAEDHDHFDSADAEMFGAKTDVRSRSRFNLEFASQGAQALQIVRDAAAAGQRFSLVFMDVRMPPGWDGLESTRRLWDVDPDLQVVICTAYSDKSWEEMMDQLGHPERVLILKKPFDAIEVLQLTHALTEKWSLLQAAHSKRCELEDLVAARTGELTAANARLESEMACHQAAADRVREQAMLLEKARDAIMVWDLDDTIQFWNSGAESLYGLASAEAIGRKISDIFTLPEEGNGLQNAREMVLEMGIWDGELKQKTQAGESATVECGWTLVLDEQERPKSIFAIHTDITAKKSFETKNLRSQRLESIGTLAGGISHDLNNILQPITLAMDILRNRFPDPSSREMLDLVTENAQRASSLVRQVLSFARGVEGDRVAIEPNDLIEEIARMVRETFPKNIELRLKTPENSWLISGDSTQLHQVLLNLCVNARDAMPAGGVLTLGIENVEIDARHAAREPDADVGRHVALTVTDTGTGIPPEFHEKIFDPFFTTKELGNDKGTGLGLATTLGIVRSHGGFITMKSSAGEGTCFRVCIPAIETESAPHPESAGPAAPSISQDQGELILVVDDEAAILNVMRETLVAFGYRVLTASDGLQGSKIFAQQPDEIDVVISDMVMPEMDGPEMIAALKTIRPGIKIIAVSGMIREESSDEIARYGVQRIITKPFTLTTILHALREVLDGKPTSPPASSI